jgi:hypothetical protein
VDSWKAQLLYELQFRVTLLLLSEALCYLGISAALIFRQPTQRQKLGLSEKHLSYFYIFRFIPRVPLHK